ncbi:MAG: twin-arginine translocase TatA/TatE family subunit [Myxococcota bacterium]
MFGFGPWEIAMIVGVALIVVGPSMLPSFGRNLGKSLKDLKTSANAFETSFRHEMERESEAAQPELGAGPEAKAAAPEVPAKDTSPA